MKIWVLFWLVPVAGAAAQTVIDGLLAGYATAGAAAPDAARGQALWTEQRTTEGEQRACTSCHGPTLSSPGKHASTGEPIEPMTASGRLTDPAKIEKWFGRNCRWTIGRDCTASEKADILTFLSGGGR